MAITPTDFNVLDFFAEIKNGRFLALTENVVVISN